MGTRRLTGHLALVALLALAACTSKPTPTSTPTRAPSLQAPSASASPTTEQLVLAAYRGMWKAYTDAGRTTDPRYEELSRYADGDALAALKAGLESNKRQNLVTKGDLVPNPQVTQLTPSETPDTASIRDCLDTASATRVKASPGGSPFTDTPGGRRTVTATAKNLNGIWKVISFVPLAVGTC